MTEKFKSKRVAKLELKVTDENGNKEKIELGGVFTSPYQGNLGVSLTLPTDELGENGYPVRDRIVAIKTAGGRKLDISEAFVNLIVYEAIAARPPFEG